MEVIILAAGQGSRLQPLTNTRPKSMVHVAGEPLIYHLVGSLRQAGIDKATVVVGHGHEHLRKYLGDGGLHGMEFRFVHQSKQLGQGHALFEAVRADPWEEADQDLMVISADAWYHSDLIEQIIHAEKPCLVTVQQANSARFGVPMLQRDMVHDLYFRRESDISLAGIYRLPRAICDDLPNRTYRLSNVIQNALARGDPWPAIAAADHEYVDVVEAGDLLEVSARLLAVAEVERQGTVEEGVVMQGLVSIGEGSIIRAGTVLRGPVHVGHHCDIGPMAFLGPNTSIRNHVHIEPFAGIQDCLLASNVVVKGGARIRNAIVDIGAQVGAGASLYVERPAMVGADAMLGPGCIAQEGATIGEDASVAPGRVVADVPDRGAAV